MPIPKKMSAVRLHGPSDLRMESIPTPAELTRDDVLIRVTSVGVCGSDMHMYRHAIIGDTRLEGPLVLGHEFGGVIEQMGSKNARDGEGRTLSTGMRVAVDPAFPCGLCEFCERGDPNLCIDLPFCGLWPTDGCLAEFIRVPARNCFPVPDSISEDEIAVLEPLGVGIHTVDLCHAKVGQSAALFGAGPVGLCILQVLRAAGVGPIYVSEPLAWRRELALELGADAAFDPQDGSVVRQIMEATGRRGVDISIEAAHGGDAAYDAAEVCAMGAKLVIVGIDPHDGISLRHSNARRKGLSIIMVRRMKMTYPRAIRMTERGLVRLAPMISHTFRLSKTPQAFEIAADYQDNVVKAIIRPQE